jgi:hypothetical protein
MSIRVRAVAPLAISVGVAFVRSEFTSNFTFHWLTVADRVFGQVRSARTFPNSCCRVVCDVGLFVALGGDREALHKTLVAPATGSVTAAYVMVGRTGAGRRAVLLGLRARCGIGRGCAGSRLDAPYRCFCSGGRPPLRVPQPSCYGGSRRVGTTTFPGVTDRTWCTRWPPREDEAARRRDGRVRWVLSTPWPWWPSGSGSRSCVSAARGGIGSLAALAARRRNRQPTAVARSRTAQRPERTRESVTGGSSAPHEWAGWTSDRPRLLRANRERRPPATTDASRPARPPHARSLCAETDKGCGQRPHRLGRRWYLGHHGCVDRGQRDASVGPVGGQVVANRPAAGAPMRGLLNVDKVESSRW